MTEGSESKKGNHIAQFSNEWTVCCLSLCPEGDQKEKRVGLIGYGYNWSMKRMRSEATQIENPFSDLAD